MTHDRAGLDELAFIQQGIHAVDHGAARIGTFARLRVQPGRAVVRHVRLGRSPERLEENPRVVDHPRQPRLIAQPAELLLDLLAGCQRLRHTSFLVPQRRQIDLHARRIQRIADQLVQIDRLSIRRERLLPPRLELKHAPQIGAGLGLAAQLARFPEQAIGLPQVIDGASQVPTLHTDDPPVVLCHRQLPEISQTFERGRGLHATGLGTLCVAHDQVQLAQDAQDPRRP